jgi:hypothetical protein
LIAAVVVPARNPIRARCPSIGIIRLRRLLGISAEIPMWRVGVQLVRREDGPLTSIAVGLPACALPCAAQACRPFSPGVKD